MDTHDHNNKITVIGIGGAGNRILNSLAGVPDSKCYSLVTLDTDKKSLHESAAETRIEAGFKWTEGIGCGGDAFKGQRAIATARPKITEAVKNSSVVVITGGFGGGTATQGASIIAGCAKEYKIPVVAVMTMPFELEGQARRQTAESGYNDLLTIADVVFCLPNDLLYSSMKSETPIKDAYVLADEEVARSIVGVVEMLRSKKLLASDFADFKNALNRKNAACCIGVGRSMSDEAQNRTHLAVSRLEASPLLGGKELISTSDVLFVSLLGGEDLSVAEAKRTISTLTRLAGKNTKVIVGINTDRSYDTTVQVCVIAVRYERESQAVEPQDAFENLFDEKPQQKSEDKKSVPSQKDTDGQMLFSFQTQSRGIFSGGEHFVQKGEDYDVPTFQRRNEVIDTGD